MNEPVIGLPTYNALNGEPDYCMRKTYCQAVQAAGGIPLLLPLLEEERALRRLYRLVDGLLLCGGGDVATDWYGAPDSGKLTLVDAARDRVEIMLTRWALEDGLPTLGICRGIQTLNVAAGGTLIQDIPSEVPGALQHRAAHNLPADYLAHDVVLNPVSTLTTILCVGVTSGPPPSLPVNSRHHQAVKDVARGFVACAHAHDGIIEAIELGEGSAFCLGVQWHPENLVPAHASMVRLCRRFVDACQR